MNFIQEKSNTEGVHGEQEPVTFIAEQEKRFLEVVKREQKRGIDYASHKVGHSIGSKISGETAKNSAKEITRKASKEALKKVAEESAKEVAKQTSKQVSKKAAKDSTSFIVTTTATTSTTVATTAAGTVAGTAAGASVNPLLGTVIGFAAGTVIGNFVGDMAGLEIDKKIVGISTKEKMLAGLNDTSGLENNESKFGQGIGKAFLTKVGYMFRRLGTGIKWGMPVLPTTIFSTLIIIVIALVCIPVMLLCMGSTPSGGYTEEFTYYCQYEEPWASYEITEGETIRKAGCGPTTLAIVYSNLTGDVMTPDVAADWTVKEGYFVYGLTRWSLFSSGVKKLGLTSQSHGKNLYDALECLPEGGMVVISVGKADGSGNALYRGEGHFMAIRGITDEGMLLVADPASRAKTEREWEYSDVEDILKNCWSVTYTPEASE